MILDISTSLSKKLNLVKKSKLSIQRLNVNLEMNQICSGMELNFHSLIQILLWICLTNSFLVKLLYQEIISNLSKVSLKRLTYFSRKTKCISKKIKFILIISWILNKVKLYTDKKTVNFILTPNQIKNMQKFILELIKIIKLSYEYNIRFNKCLQKLVVFSKYSPQLAKYQLAILHK